MKEKILFNIQKGVTKFDDLDEDLRLDVDICLSALDFNPEYIEKIDDSLFLNKIFVLKAIPKNELVISKMDTSFFDDEEVMLEAFKNYSGYLELASMRIYKMCVNKDAVKVLSSIVNYEKINSELSVLNDLSGKTTKKNKI